MSFFNILYWGIPIITTLIIITQRQKIKNLYTGFTFFNKSYIVENFRSVTPIWPNYSTARCGKSVEFITNKKELPSYFYIKNELFDLKQWLKDQWVTGLVVLKIDSPTKANILFEEYYLGNTQRTKTISWSINKSVVSALIGVAVSEGKIKSVNDLVTTYVPSLQYSAYSDVKIKDVLQMSSGVNFSEDYENPFSDINFMGYWLSVGWDMESFIKTLSKNRNSGIEHDYISVDTQVLGMVLKGATGQSLTSYLEEKIWKKCGFSSNCDWLLDSSGMELAFGTLNTCTRNYAIFGWLYLNGGLSPLDGSKIIDEQWITESVSCTESHLKPSYPNNFGYGYQWWLPGSVNNKTEAKGDYMAIGVYNQFIYVDPESKIVIAMNSANPHYNKQDNVYGSNDGEIQAVGAFRAIVRNFTT